MNVYDESLQQATLQTLKEKAINLEGETNALARAVSGALGKKAREVEDEVRLVRTRIETALTRAMPLEQRQEAIEELDRDVHTAQARVVELQSGFRRVIWRRTARLLKTKPRQSDQQAVQRLRQELARLQREIEGLRRQRTPLPVAPSSSKGRHGPSHGEGFVPPKPINLADRFADIQSNPMYQGGSRALLAKYFSEATGIQPSSRTETSPAESGSTPAGKEAAKKPGEEQRQPLEKGGKEEAGEKEKTKKGAGGKR